MIVEEHCNRFYTVQKLLSCNILSFCVVWLGLSFINASGHCFAGNTGRQNGPIFRLVRMPTLPKLGKALFVWLEKEKDFQLPLGLFYPVALESTGRGRNERDEVGKESNTNQPFTVSFTGSIALEKLGGSVAGTSALLPSDGGHIQHAPCRIKLWTRSTRN